MIDVEPGQVWVNGDRHLLILDVGRAYVAYKPLSNGGSFTCPYDDICAYCTLDIQKTLDYKYKSQLKKLLDA